MKSLPITGSKGRADYYIFLCECIPHMYFNKHSGKKKHLILENSESALIYNLPIFVFSSKNLLHFKIFH